MAVTAEFSVYPIGVGESLSEHIAKVVDIIDRSGVQYKLGPMGTTFQAASVAEAFALLERCIDTLEKAAPRLVTSIKIDSAKREMGGLDERLARVASKLGREAIT